MGVGQEKKKKSEENRVEQEVCIAGPNWRINPVYVYNALLNGVNHLDLS